MAPLIRHLLDEGRDVHLSVVTRTGHAHARRLLGARIGLSFLPWDLPGFMARFVDRLRPSVLLLTETEFWPGMLRACARRRIPVIGINTRISDRSFPRYRATRWLWRRWLRPIRRFLPQSDTDARRLIALGVDAERIQVVGNLKYALSAPDVDARALRARIDPSMRRPVVLLASSHEDEERRVLRMLPHWRRVSPDLLLLIVPRHPERFDAVAACVREHGERLHRWRQGEVCSPCDVLLVDAMGVLRSLYAVADIAIVGGSLVDIGGHNPLEAAVCGRGVVMGPHVQNFRAVVDELRKAGGLLLARDDAEVSRIVMRWIEHPEELRRLHAHAADFMRRQHDVLAAVLRQLRPWLPPS